MERPLMMVVLVDALGWSACEGGQGEPWLADLLPYRRPLETVLGFSSGAIPSLLSGTLPSENGHWLMYRLANGTSPFGAARGFARLPARLRRSHRVGRLLHRCVAQRVRGYFSLYEVPWALLPWFDVAEKQPLYRPGGLGERRTWFDEWARRGWRVREWDWRAPEARNAEEIVQAAAREGERAADVLFWYTPGIDERGHGHGPESAAVRTHLAWLGEQVRRIVRAADEAGREVWLYVLSDHGMTAVTHVADVMGEAERALAEAGAGLTRGPDWLAFYDSTLARFWWKSEAARARLRPAVRERLAALGVGRWLSAEEERAFGVHFADRRYGDDFFLADVGVLFAPSYMGSRPVAGMHGYHPGEPTSRAVILTNRPLPDGLHHVTGVAEHLRRESNERDSCPARS